MGQLIFGILCLLLTSIMLVAPKSWEDLTEKENRFWVKLGLISEESAEKVKRIERSLGFKLFILLMSLIFTGLGIYEVM